MIVMLYIASAAASAEAERLGRQLAAAGSIEVILPAVTAKETDQVIADHPELTAIDQELLRHTGQKVANEARDKLINAFGHQYALALNVMDLRALVGFNRTRAAQHYRAALPRVTIAGLADIGKLDFKGDLTKAFCAQTGKLCSK